MRPKTFLRILLGVAASAAACADNGALTLDGGAALGGGSGAGQMGGGGAGGPGAAGAGGAPTDAAAEQTPAMPGALAFTPSSADFGYVEAGEESPLRELVLSNVGGSPLPPPAITVSDLFAVKTNACGVPLNPGDACVVGVTFGPGSQRPPTRGTLEARAGTAAAQAELRGWGVARSHPLLSPISLDFGPVAIGQRSPALALVLTTQNHSLQNLQPSVAGSTMFAIDPQQTTCASTVPAYSSCTIAVVFLPAALGKQYAALVVSATGESAPMSALIGTGVRPATLAWKPDKLDFGVVPAGSTSPPLKARVSNQGDLDATDFTLRLDPPTADFAFKGDCPNRLAPGQDCEVTVTYSPTRLGEEQVDLVTTAATATPARMILHGQVVDAHLAISPPGLDFKDAVVGRAGPTATFLIRNVNPFSLEQLQVTVEGAAAAAFLIGNDHCSGRPLYPDDQCSVDVTFRPNNTQLFGATLVVRADVSGVVSATLRGTGLPDTLP